MDSNTQKHESEMVTCKHQYTKGQLRGKFCGKIFSGRLKSYGGYCSEHKRLQNHELFQCIGQVRDGLDLESNKKFLYKQCQELTSSYTHRCTAHRSNNAHKYRKKKIDIMSLEEKEYEISKQLLIIEDKKEEIANLEFLGAFNL